MINKVIQGFHASGRCAYCMKKAFQFSVLTWVVSILLKQVDSFPVLFLFALAMAILATINWLIHVVRYSWHKTKMASSDRPVDRHLRDFVKMAGAAVIISSFSKFALADKPCSITCSNGTQTIQCRDGEECNCHCAGSGVPECYCNQR